jgi:RHS repeat-associated protein
MENEKSGIMENKISINERVISNIENGGREISAVEAIHESPSRYVQWSTINQGFSIHENPYRYSAYYFDTESMMYYCKTRYYSSDLMRFINRDTYDVSNRYVYCDNNPIEKIDPNGHAPIDKSGDTTSLRNEHKVVTHKATTGSGQAGESTSTDTTTTPGHRNQFPLSRTSSCPVLPHQPNGSTTNSSSEGQRKFCCFGRPVKSDSSPKLPEKGQYLKQGPVVCPMELFYGDGPFVVAEGSARALLLEDYIKRNPELAEGLRECIQTSGGLASAEFDNSPEFMERAVNLGLMPPPC